MKKMKATGWKKMQSTPRTYRRRNETPLNLHCVFITAHHDVTKLADVQWFWRGNKRVNTEGTDGQTALQRAANNARDSKFCVVGLVSIDVSEERSVFNVNRLKFRAEHAVLHTSQETCTALHGDST
jgi:hypothetical protein